VLVDAYTLQLWHKRHLKRTRKFSTHDQVFKSVRRRIYLYDIMRAIYLDQSSNLRPLHAAEIANKERRPIS
jgi:hypothetical protein